MASEKEIQNLFTDKSRALAKSNWKEAAELCNFLGNKLRERGRLDEALAEHEEELRLCQQLNDEPGCGLAHRCIGEVYSEMQDYQKALRSLKVFLQISEKRKDMVEMQRAWATIGRAYFMKEDLKRAETAFTMALKLADKAKGSVKEGEWNEMRCRSYLNLALIFDQRDEVNEGCHYYTLAIQLASKHKLTETLHRCQNSLALFYQKLKLYPRALKLLNDAIASARSLKNKVFECEYLISKGHLLLLMNNSAAARKSFRKAVHTKSPVEEDRDKALAKYKVTSKICKALKLLHRLGSAAAPTTTQGDGGVEISENEKVNKSKTLLHLHEKLGDLFSEVEVYTTAIQHYMQQLSLAIEIDASPSLIGTIYVSIAQTLFDNKQYEEALDYFNKERECRKGNAVEETRTTLKIIEICIAMNKSVKEVRELYESALLKFANDKRSLQKILKDYALYLDQELEIEKGSEIRRKLLQLTEADKRLTSQDSEEEEDNENNDGTESLRLSDVSSPSSSSDSEDEERAGSRYLKNSDGRPKRSRIKKIKKNELGETPLHRACIEGDLKRVEKLLNDGHPINARDHCGWLPIHEAANHDYPDIVRLLIQHGADLNDPGTEMCGKVTPLHDACSNGCVQVIEVLLQMGADVCKFDQDGNTPVDCLRNWRLRVGNLSDEEEAVYRKTVQLLEEKMKAVGFDVDAERNRPVVQINISPDKHDQRRDRAAKLSRRRPCNDSPPSSPSPPRQRKKSRKLDRDLDFDDPDVARGEYRAAIKSLRRTRDPGLDFDDDVSEEVVNKNNDTALIDAAERVDVDEWLIDDMAKQGKGKHRELYESGLLPKKQITRRIHPAAHEVRAPKSIPPLAPTVSCNNEHSASKDCESGAEADAVEVVEVEEEERAVVTAKDPVPLSHLSKEKSDASAKKLLFNVGVEDKVFLIHVPDDRRPVSWLIQETVNRYYQLVKKKPIIYLETPDKAILSPDDLIIDVISGKEVQARVQSFESLPLNVKYLENCKLSGVPVLSDLDQLLQRVECNGLLNLSNVMLSAPQEKVLVDVVTGSSRLVSVDLSFRNLAASEHQSLLQCLMQSSPQLRELRLSGCGISSQDLTFLADLSLPISLLDLSYNSLHDDSLPFLCRLISSLHNLTTVYLFACDFTANILHHEELTHTVSTHSSLVQVLVDESLIDSAAADLIESRFKNRLQVQKWKKVPSKSRPA